MYIFGKLGRRKKENASKEAVGQSSTGREKESKNLH